LKVDVVNNPKIESREKKSLVKDLPKLNPPTKVVVVVIGVVSTSRTFLVTQGQETSGIEAGVTTGFKLKGTSLILLGDLSPSSVVAIYQ